MQVLQRLVFTLALALVGCSTPPNPEFEFETQRECDTLSLAFDSTGYEMFCHAWTEDGWDPGVSSVRASYEVILANATSSYVTLAAETAGNRTYLEAGLIKDLIGATTWFTDVRRWGDSTLVEDFEVWRFEGRWEQTDGVFKQCAGFLRHVGYVAGSQGYKQRVYGTYCIDGNDPVSQDVISRFLASVRY